MSYSKGLWRTRFYTIYSHIKDRCNNKNNKSYYLYGGRGIVNLRESFADFVKDMYPGYIEHCEKYGEKNTTIDRIDVNGNYCKENCRWATYSIQSINRRNVRNIVVNGKEYNAQTLANECGIPTDTASWRITNFLKGKIKQESLLAHGKINQVAKIMVDGKIYTRDDIMKITGLKNKTVRMKMCQYKKGLISKEELFRQKLY